MAKKSSKVQSTLSAPNQVKRLAELLRFDSRKMMTAKPRYVAFIDVMGAGQSMRTSINQVANDIIRVHLAVWRAIQRTGINATVVPVNDGSFIVSDSKADVMALVRESLTLLVARFLYRPRPLDRCLVRAAIAFGPVYTGNELSQGVSGKVQSAGFGSVINSVVFGPPVIQAYESESMAAPYGVAVHESARAFAPVTETPFRSLHWQWWEWIPELDPFKNKIETDIHKLIQDMQRELLNYMDFLKTAHVYTGLNIDKVDKYESQIKSYFGIN
jgi:class 3 adenylate cyclase